MKAKDLALRFKEEPTLEMAKKIAFDMVMETKELADMRGVKSNSGIAAVLKQQNEKWQALTRLCPELNPNGFKSAIHQLVPVSAELLP